MRLNRDQMRGKAQTVHGLVDPQSLGHTLMHEHLIWNITRPERREDDALSEGPDCCTYWKLMTGGMVDPRNTTQRDHDLAAREASHMVDAGGKTIVELTIGGLAPDPEGLVWVSQQSGANIVMGCGFYVDDYQDPATKERTVDSLAQQIIDQIQVGAWDTQVRAGIIGEIGCQWPWTDFEKKVLLSSIIAQQETGSALTIHPARHEDHPWMIVEFLKEHGADLSRTIIDHIDRTIFDDDRLLKLADSGVILEWDLFGQENTYYPHSDVDLPNDGLRIKTIKRLIDRGYTDQVVISHDICHAIRLTEFGGHGYSHIYHNVLPLMKKRGYSEKDVQAIIVDNPQRLLTFI